MDTRSVRQMIDRALGSVRQALRGRLQLANAGKQVILVQAEGLAGETFNNAELFQQPGLRSIPLTDMQAIVLPLSGRSAHGVVVAMSNGKMYVTSLQPGEVALFNETDGEANSIILRNGKVIDMQCDTLNITATTAINMTAPTVTMHTTNTSITASGAATIDTPTTAITGNVNVAKVLDATSDVKAAGKSLKAHVHNGVAAGSANSGVNQ